MKSQTQRHGVQKVFYQIQSPISGSNFSNNKSITHNQFYNILRLFDVLPNFPFTTSETMCDYYL